VGRFDTELGVDLQFIHDLAIAGRDHQFPGELCIAANRGFRPQGKKQQVFHPGLIGFRIQRNRFPVFARFAGYATLND
jgi:hypothetical protein